MGSKRNNRSASRFPKRNKRAKGARNAWIKRKCRIAQNTSTLLLPNRETDVWYERSTGFAPETVSNLDSNIILHEPDTDDSSLLDNADEQVRNSFGDLDIHRKNPKWAFRKYERKPKCIKTEDVNIIEEFGVLPSYECDLKKEDTPSASISGNRIVELGYVLDRAIELQYEHSKICPLGRLSAVEEMCKSMGLVSTIVLNCSMCPRRYEFNTENPERPASLINTGVVCGTLASGSTNARLSELLACMRIPPMPDSQFSSIESTIGESCKDSLWLSVQAAGVKKERENDL